MISFPIDSLKLDILKALNENSIIILKSSPGSGKTTRVPLFLLEQFKQKIYILEPRRLAAKLASEFVAKSLNEEVGKTVGHIFKYEYQANANTRIIFFTEGTFLRILKDQRKLSDVDVIILDEFHERHLTTDTTLSYLLYLKKSLPHLKIIIMSATLDTTKLESFLISDFKVIEQLSQRFELKINYLQNNTLVLKDTLERKVLNAIRESLDIPGDVLVFLPGMFEINKCAEMIEGSSYAHLFAIYILHGDLSNDSMSNAFKPSKLKKIILATNIAESSLTINGIRIVIDSGLHRTIRLNPTNSSEEIVTVKISQSSAIQRANRANREDNGVVFRLYPELDLLKRDLFDIPEILRSDLSDLIIKTYDLFNIGLSDLSFLDTPQPSEIDKAIRYLEQLNFIEDHSLTKVGKEIGNWPYSPRISKILYSASFYDNETFNEVLNELAQWIEPNQTKRFINQIKTYVNPKNLKGRGDKDQIFLSGFVDQIAKIKNAKSDEVIHRNGEIYKISNRIHHQIDTNHPLWIIIDTDNRNEISKMFPIEEDWLFELDHFPIDEKIDLTFSNNKIYEEKWEHIDAIILNRSKKLFDSHHLTDAKKDKIKILLKKEMQIEIEKFYSTNDFKRYYLLAKQFNYSLDDYNFYEYLNLQIDSIILTINNDENWKESLFSFYLFELKNKIDPENLIDLDRSLPLTLQLSDRRIVEINYELNQSPWVQSYIQDFYGLKEVPKILNGAETLTIHLIGPHKRALQVTKDLNSFWNKTYKEMYGELKREYPRHYWPEDPAEAKPILLLRQVQSK